MLTFFLWWAATVIVVASLWAVLVWPTDEDEFMDILHQLEDDCE